MGEIPSCECVFRNSVLSFLPCRPLTARDPQISRRQFWGVLNRVFCIPVELDCPGWFILGVNLYVLLPAGRTFKFLGYNAIWVWDFIYCLYISRAVTLLYDYCVLLLLSYFYRPVFVVLIYCMKYLFVLPWDFWLSLRKICSLTPQSTPGDTENPTYESGTKAAPPPLFLRTIKRSEAAQPDSAEKMR
jgi:hypothetical protein